MFITSFRLWQGIDSITFGRLRQFCVFRERAAPLRSLLRGAGPAGLAALDLTGGASALQGVALPVCSVLCTSGHCRPGLGPGEQGIHGGERRHTDVSSIMCSAAPRRPASSVCLPVRPPVRTSLSPFPFPVSHRGPGAACCRRRQMALELSNRVAGVNRSRLPEWRTGPGEGLKPDRSFALEVRVLPGIFPSSETLLGSGGVRRGL